jgi:hypothetical protein
MDTPWNPDEANELLRAVLEALAEQPRPLVLSRYSTGSRKTSGTPS